MAARIGNAKWQGSLKDGNGEVTVGESNWTAPYSFQSRFEDGGSGTNPEELIAAAHASCYSMALSNILHEHDHASTSVDTTARVYLRQVDGAPTLAKIELEVDAVVPDIDEAHFLEHAEEAKAGCPISRALAGVPEIELTARLAN